MGSELAAAIDRYHVAAAEFIKGNPEPEGRLLSPRRCHARQSEARGWAGVEKTMECASAQFSGGEVVGFDRLSERLTSELAYIVEIERVRAKIGKSDEPSLMELHVTSVLRPEDGTWKVVHGRPTRCRGYHRRFGDVGWS